MWPQVFAPKGSAIFAQGDSALAAQAQLKAQCHGYWNRQKAKGFWGLVPSRPFPDWPLDQGHKWHATACKDDTGQQNAIMGHVIVTFLFYCAKQ